VQAKLGIALTTGGVLILVWLGITLWRGDPFTAFYTRHEQHGLARRLASVETQWHATRPAKARATQAARAAWLAREAAAYAKSLRNGSPVGEIAIPKIGLHMVVVQGTTTDDLERGPGHYDAESGINTKLPGMGGVIGIAGHRTTYLEPFRHIDALHRGDRIKVKMPYGTFTYQVVGHQTVLPTDWRILAPRGFEELVLSACTPLYSASHRLVVYARLVAAQPRTAIRA
jgi:sortase A